MAASKYTYSISGDFPTQKVAPTRLGREIDYSSISTSLDSINTDGDDCDIWFVDALSGPDQTTLDGIVAAHTGDPMPNTTLNVVTTNPTVNDDVTWAFEIGSQWLNTDTNKQWVCLDASEGAAVWSTEADEAGTTEINNNPISDTPPGEGDVYVWNATSGEWEPGSPSAGSLAVWLAEDVAESSTTATTPQQKLRLTINPGAGKYRIGWSFFWRYAYTNADFRARIEVDDDNTEEIQIRPKSSSGHQKLDASGFFYIDLTEGSHNIDLDYWSGKSGKTATIWKVRIEVWKVDQVN